MEEKNYPKISCLIPVCDREKFIAEAVKCVLGQSYKAIEIVIINNGHKKISLPKDLQDKATIHHFLPYAGVAQALNFGVGLCKGDYIAFLEDDDLWNPDYLKNVVSAVQTGSRCVVSRIDKLIDGKIIPYKNADGKLTMENLLVHNPGMNMSNTVIEKKLYYQVGGLDPKLMTSADKAMGIEILKKNIPITVLPENQEVARFHREWRLGKSNQRLYENHIQFFLKYRKEMKLSQKVKNLKKILKKKWNILFPPNTSSPDNTSLSR